MDFEIIAEEEFDLVSLGEPLVHLTGLTWFECCLTKTRYHNAADENEKESYRTIYLDGQSVLGPARYGMTPAMPSPGKLYLAVACINVLT